MDCYVTARHGEHCEPELPQHAIWTVGNRKASGRSKSSAVSGEFRNAVIDATVPACSHLRNDIDRREVS